MSKLIFAVLATLVAVNIACAAKAAFMKKCGRDAKGAK